MEMDKLKNWLDLTKQYASESFWKEIFNQQAVQHQGSQPTGGLKMQDLFPRCDLFEFQDCLYVEAELPGAVRENINIILQGQNLIIKGTYPTLKPTLQYYLKERPDRSFEKTITLPFKVNRHRIQTSLEGGVLSIVLPVIPEDEAVPITIDLNAENHPQPL
ncbi:Hsp20/alpha crystallin family protein [Mesobacillus zeae]|uniref:Hsp20/alpha crystallin family protein n=1 Tax=Mesobacillus zeae TaxID=1917180 RepID=A0A398B6P7_9BACI|nr:Hsp20/alpha crystallin family protein [Mesobacillus zeae]RID85522.1 Hsp20/alpha crystallin family protein [Mesobacillus zeae]